MNAYKQKEKKERGDLEWMGSNTKTSFIIIIFLNIHFFSFL